MRHLMTAAAYVKEVVRRRMVRMVKETSQRNRADVLTKHVKREVLDRHLRSLNL